MEYNNPQLPENNVSKEHPLKDFSTLLIGSLALAIILSVTLSIAGSWLAGFIPYSAEKKVSGLYDISLHSDNKEFPEIAAYLQELADKISEVQDLPEDMKITVHYMNSDTMNAFATIGGNVFMYRGLLERLTNENTLVTLLSHEIAHVKYRHPIKSFGGSISVAIAMTTVGASADTSLLGEAGMLSTLQFNRNMETQSDIEAMHNLQAIYGHINGGAELFRIFSDAKDDSETNRFEAFTSTHPLDEKRIQSFSDTAQKNNWSDDGELTPLPDFFTF